MSATDYAAIRAAGDWPRFTHARDMPPDRVPVTPLERHCVVVLMLHGGEDSYAGGIEAPDSIEWLGYEAIQCAELAHGEESQIVLHLLNTGWWSDEDEDDTRARAAAAEITQFAAALPQEQTGEAP